MTSVRDLFTNKKDKIVIWQTPNIPLVAWLAFFMLAKLLHTGNWHTWAGYLSKVSLLVWSILEIGWGASYFRRSLGLLVLSVTFYTIIQTIA